MIFVRRVNTCLFLVFMALFCLSHVTLWAQENISLLSPYHALYNHLSNLNDNNYHPEKAALSFPPQFPQDVREDMARRLKMVYDANGLEVNFSEIPRNNDFVDSLSMNPTFTPFPYKFPEIQLSKSGDLWLYTVSSALIIEELYREAFPLWAENLMKKLPPVFNHKYFGIAGWQYLGFLVLVFLLVLINYLLSYAIDLIILRFVYQNQKLETTHNKLVYKIATFISMVIMIYVFKFFVAKLLFPASLSRVLFVVTDIVHTLVILFLLFYIISLIKIYLLRYTAQTENKLDDQLAPVFIKGLKIIVGFIAFMHILALLGVNITALIAGASIGGLALALAAQDTFKNMFGSIMVFLDKPFEIGDFIITSDIEGTVDNVGLRSTRIRKIDTSVISVPNGNLANTTITNLGKRLNRIMELNIGVLYSTTTEKLENFIRLLRSVPGRHHEITPDNQLIYLRNLADSAIVVYFRVHIVVATFDEELAVRERIIFDIIRSADEAGVSFAFPSTSVYLEPTSVTDRLPVFKTT